VISDPKPPPVVLGCIEVVALIQGLELTPEAHLFEAFQADDVGQVDQLVAQGVGHLGTIDFTAAGPDEAAFDSVADKVKDHLRSHPPFPGTLLWVDEDWPGRGGDAESQAVSITTTLLDVVQLAAGFRLPPRTINFAGTPCPTRLFVRTSSGIIL
jgi:hypothetical protein